MEKFYISVDEIRNDAVISLGLPHRAKDIYGNGYWYADECV